MTSQCVLGNFQAPPDFDGLVDEDVWPPDLLQIVGILDEFVGEDGCLVTGKGKGGEFLGQGVLAAITVFQPLVHPVHPGG